MKAAQIVAPRRIEIVDVEEPDLGAYPEGTVKIKTHLSAICGTDMPSFVLERPPSGYPSRLGLPVHECIGVVAQSNSERFREGDKVLALPTQVGGASEYFLSHEEVTVPLVDYEPKDHILMAQPLGTVIWACRKLGNLLDRDAVVIGQGPMGLLISHLLSNLGAKTVVGVDPVDFRLEASRRMQATHTVNPKREDLTAAVAGITDGRMADLTVEAVGHQMETINQCMDLVKRDGTVLAFGIPDEDIYAFHYRTLITKNIRVIGSVQPEAQRDFPLAMDMIAQGRIDVSPMITHHLPFTEAQQGFELALNRKDEAIKIVLDYD